MNELSGHEEDLDVEVIFALGRLTWAALNLDAQVGDFAQLILVRGRLRTPIGELLEDAMSDLRARPENLAVTQALGWCERAKRALALRNQVMHGEPVSEYPGGPGATRYLVTWPNSGGEPVKTPLDVENLDAISSELFGVVDGFEDVMDVLFGAKEIKSGSFVSRAEVRWPPRAQPKRGSPPAVDE